MRYFTKQWYNDTVLAEMCFQIKSSPKAERPDEKYFKSLYSAQESWFVRNEKRTAKFAKLPFDKAAAEAKFAENFNENLEYVKANLPEDILSRVADVRLLAIGSASYETTQAIVRYCGQVNRRCEAVKEEYESANEKLADSIGWYKINSLNLITNAKIASAEQVGEDFVITTSPEYTDIACKVTLSSAKVCCLDEKAVGASVLFIELLPTETEGEIELNLLCATEDGKSAELSLLAKDIETVEI